MKVLLTGASGTLGTAIRASKSYASLAAPSSSQMDLTDARQVLECVRSGGFDQVLHCAAFARLIRCEHEPEKAIAINIVGTANLVSACLAVNPEIRFVHLSTDAVYQGLTGHYSETDATIPANQYGWSKLGAEASVRMLKNHCVIRTRFFDPDQIPVSTAADDMFTSKIPINELVEAIVQLANSDFVGVVNVGHERQSEFNRNRQHRTDTRSCKRADINRELPMQLPADCSMETRRWKDLVMEFSSARKHPKT